MSNDTITCPLCERLGFVRLETVIRGPESFTTFFCGGCGYGWKETAPEPAPSKPNRSRP